jgi:hypothetical protein
LKLLNLSTHTQAHLFQQSQYTNNLVNANILCTLHITSSSHSTEISGQEQVKYNHNTRTTIRRLRDSNAYTIYTQCIHVICSQGDKYDSQQYYCHNKNGDELTRSCYHPRGRPGRPPLRPCSYCFLAYCCCCCCYHS